jgi:ABC-type transport system substrate-binding protein
MEDAEFFDALNRGESPAFINDWTWDNGDPDNIMFSLFSAPSVLNRIGYKNDRVNELNLQAETEADAEKRTAMYAEAQKLILQDAAMVIFGYPQRAIGAQKKVQNLVVSPVGSLPLREVDLAS